MQETRVEVVSAKQRGGSGKLAGEGETQLEKEKRLINEKESRIKKEILAENERRKQLRLNRKKEHSVIPRIAIVITTTLPHMSN